MQYSKHSILRYINKPPKIIFWDVDEAIAFILPFGVLCLVNQLFLGCVFGALCYVCLKHIKNRVGICAFSHFVYWYAPTPKGKYKVYIPSYIREYIG